MNREKTTRMDHKRTAALCRLAKYFRPVHKFINRNENVYEVLPHKQLTVIILIWLIRNDISPENYTKIHKEVYEHIDNDGNEKDVQVSRERDDHILDTIIDKLNTTVEEVDEHTRDRINNAINIPISETLFGTTGLDVLEQRQVEKETNRPSNRGKRKPVIGDGVRIEHMGSNVNITPVKPTQKEMDDFATFLETIQGPLPEWHNPDNIPHSLFDNSSIPIPQNSIVQAAETRIYNDCAAAAYPEQPAVTVAATHICLEPPFLTTTPTHTAPIYPEPPPPPPPPQPPNTDSPFTATTPLVFPDNDLLGISRITDPKLLYTTDFAIETLENSILTRISNESDIERDMIDILKDVVSATFEMLKKELHC